MNSCLNCKFYSLGSEKEPCRSCIDVRNRTGRRYTKFVDAASSKRISLLQSLVENRDYYGIMKFISNIPSTSYTEFIAYMEENINEKRDNVQ